MSGEHFKSMYLGDWHVKAHLQAQPDWGWYYHYG